MWGMDYTWMFFTFDPNSSIQEANGQKNPILGQRIFTENSHTCPSTRIQYGLVGIHPISKQAVLVPFNAFLPALYRLYWSISLYTRNKNQHINVQRLFALSLYGILYDSFPTKTNMVQWRFIQYEMSIDCRISSKVKNTQV